MVRMLLDAATVARWRVGRETAKLIGATGPESTERTDLCHVCHAATIANAAALRGP